MHFDAALNVVWLVLGMGAFVLALRASHFMRCGGTALPSMHLAGAIVLAGTLFPYVSASDDLVWMEASSRAEHTTEHQSRSTGTASSLIALLSANDSLPASRTLRVPPTFTFIGFAVIPDFHSLHRDCTANAGRSPPSNQA